MSFVQQIASPCSSELSSDMERLLQLNDEDDDATSKAAPMPSEMEQELFNPQPKASSPHQVLAFNLSTCLHHTHFRKKLIF